MYGFHSQIKGPSNSLLEIIHRAFINSQWGLAVGVALSDCAFTLTGLTTPSDEFDIHDDDTT
jgi:hypothetical protein